MTESLDNEKEECFKKYYTEQQPNTKYSACSFLFELHNYHSEITLKAPHECKHIARTEI